MRRWLPYLILLVCTRAGAVDMTDAEFYRVINLDHPGLDDVRSALAAGDTVSATEALLVYYRRRESVNYFPLPTGGNVADADDNVAQYFTLVGVRLNATRDDGGIDWTMRYSGDTEWHWQFHRMDWLRNLARVYGRTGDAQYAEAWAAHMIDWATNNVPGYPRTLDTGNRLRQWVESYQYVIREYGAPSVSAEDHLTILKSMILQVRFLRDNWRSTGNWGVSETRGMGAVVAMFPEFRFEPDDARQDWIDLVFSRLHHHLDGDFLPDGVQFEVSPMYHALAYRNILVTYQLFAMNGIYAGDEFLAAMVRPAEFLMHVARPDGALSPIGDSDEAAYILDHLESAGDVFGRDDMVYAATQGTRGTPPIETLRLFYDGGFAFMRDGWGTDAASLADSKYLVMTYGSNAPWHAHFDLLGIEVYAAGRPIIRDAGRYTYSNTDGWRDYFKATSAHNTVVVDGRNQLTSARGYASGAEGAGFSYLEGHHKAYPGTRHDRRIVFVDGAYWLVADLLTGADTRTNELKYRLDTIYRNRTTIDEATGAVTTRDFGLYSAHQRAEPRTDLSWISTIYGERRAAPVVTFEQNGSGAVAFETAIVPYDSRPEPESVARVTVLDDADETQPDDAGVAVRVSFSDSADLVILNYDGHASLTADDVRMEGATAIIGDDGGEFRYALVAGRSLTRGAQALIDVADGTATVGMRNRRLTVTGSDFGSVRAWAPGVTHVSLNGEAQGFTRDGEYIIVSDQQETRAEAPAQDAHTLSVSHYPNPAAHRITFRIEMAAPEHVRLELYDLLGRRIGLVIDEAMPAGTHDVSRAVADLPPGLYLYRLASGGTSLAGSITIAR